MTIALFFYCVVTRSQFKSNFDYGSERAEIHIIVVKTASCAEKFNSNLEHETINIEALGNNFKYLSSRLRICSFLHHDLFLFNNLLICRSIDWLLHVNRASKPVMWHTSIMAMWYFLDNRKVRPHFLFFLKIKLQHRFWLFLGKTGSASQNQSLMHKLDMIGRS